MTIRLSRVGWELAEYLDRWENKSGAQRAGETAAAWDRWIIASCVERNGGHVWWLDWNTEDGLWLHCRYCPASVDELYPDGHDLIFADLPLQGGRVLRIEYGSVALASQCRVYSGPVRARVHAEKYYSWEYGGYEHNAWVVVEAA
jgi:hypothetical protein